MVPPALSQGLKQFVTEQGHDGVTTSFVSLKQWLRITERYYQIYERDYRWVFD
jgi:hypothetical protein